VLPSAFADPTGFYVLKKIGSSEESVGASGFGREPNRGFQGITGQKECLWVVGNLIFKNRAPAIREVLPIQCPGHFNEPASPYSIFFLPCHA